MGATASKQPHPEVKLAVAQVAANGQSAAEKMDHTAQVSSAAKADDASLDKPEAALEKAPDAPLDAVKGKASGVPDVTVDMLTELFKSHRAMANTAVQKAGPCKTGGIGSDMMAAAMVGCGRLAGRGGGAPSNALLETFLQLKGQERTTDDSIADAKAKNQNEKRTTGDMFADSSTTGEDDDMRFDRDWDSESLDSDEDATCKEAMSLNAAAAQAAGSGADWAPGGHDEVFMKVATPLRNTRGKPGVIGARS